MREQTIKAYGRLRDAHLLIMAILAGALDRINGKIVPFDWAHDRRQALVAQTSETSAAQRQFDLALQQLLGGACPSAI